MLSAFVGYILNLANFQDVGISSCFKNLYFCLSFFSLQLQSHFFFLENRIRFPLSLENLGESDELSVSGKSLLHWMDSSN